MFEAHPPKKPGPCPEFSESLNPLQAQIHPHHVKGKARGYYSPPSYSISRNTPEEQASLRLCPRGNPKNWQPILLMNSAFRWRFWSSQQQPQKLLGSRYDGLREAFRLLGSMSFVNCMFSDSKKFKKLKVQSSTSLGRCHHRCLDFSTWTTDIQVTWPFLSHKMFFHVLRSRFRQQPHCWPPRGKQTRLLHTGCKVPTSCRSWQQKAPDSGRSVHFLLSSSISESRQGKVVLDFLMFLDSHGPGAQTAKAWHPRTKRTVRQKLYGKSRPQIIWLLGRSVNP